MNWTRQHDAWIARECEGLEVRALDLSPSGEPCAFWVWSLDKPNHLVSSYNTDPAACIRAAEAWRRKGKLRIVRLSLHSRGCSARLYDGLNWINEGPHTEPAAALAQAFYRATGGPA